MNKISEITMPEEWRPNLKNLNSVIATCDHIAKYALNILKSGQRPLMIAGDHSSAMGSVSATSVYSNGETGLIWIDAHPDINTNKTTITGNIHGMPVAALLGMGEPSLTKFLSDHPKIKPENIVMIGLRDIDAPEADFLRDLHIRYYTWQATRSIGLSVCIKEAVHYLLHCNQVHISFDIDSMDPKLMPGVSVPVAEGFTQEDVRMMIPYLLRHLPVASMDIVEFNHAHDINNATANFVSELVDIIQSI
jgi:arginase